VNTFETVGDTVYMTCFDRKGHPKPDKVIFDLADLELVKMYSWYIGKRGETLYAMTSVKVGNKWTTLSLHQYLLPTQEPLSVDHINRIGLDNRRSNLRRATNQEQCVNQGMLKNNTSGVKGVCWHKQCQKWMAHIKVNRERIHLGLYDTIGEAAQARLGAEAKYFDPIPKSP